MILQDLYKKDLINPPNWLIANTFYLTKMGSVAYGVSNDSSDLDIYGLCIPPKRIVFSHLDGHIEGFGKQKEKFEQWQEHHVIDKDSKREYDFNVYNIVKYFQLAMDNNPNMIDSLYTPLSCVIHTTKIGNMVRDNRDMFLHKGAFHKFRGYSYSQLNKADSVKNEPSVVNIRKFEEEFSIPHETTYAEAKIRENLNQLTDLDYKKYIELFEIGIRKTKRFESQKKFNTDVKFLYHLARLLDECEQILTLGTIDLQRSKEYMKAIRRGDVSEEELKKWFSVKEKEMETIYANSTLPYSPDEAKIKTLLVNCLEEHYGSLKDAFVLPDAPVMALQEIEAVLEKHKHLFRK